jgi:hypothetical protein
MSDPKPLPTPDVRYMFDASGKPTQAMYEFLDRLVKVAKDANTAITTLQGGTAPVGAQYVTLALDATLTAERRAVAGNGIAFNDGGANGDLTISAAAGAVLQTLQATYATNTDLSTTTPLDDTTPTNTEGTEVLSQAITLANAANKVRAEVKVWGAVNTASTAMIVALFRGSTCINVADHTFANTNFPACVSFELLEAPGSTGPHTYSVRVGASSGNVRLNGSTASRLFGGTAKSTLTLTEIKG